MNRQHLLSRLARRGWPIVYSTGAPHLWSRHTPEWKNLRLLGRLAPRDGVLVDRPGRFPMRLETNRTWDGLAIKAHLRRLLAAFPASRPVICYVFHPRFWPYVEALNPDRLVYHVYDAFHLTTDWNHTMEVAQARLVARASLLVATSLPMAESFPGRPTLTVEELPNAVDFDLFAPTKEPPCPPDLSSIPRPRIVHPGSVNEKTDLELILALARARPEWNWVVLGRLSSEAEGGGEFGRQWRACVALPNVNYLGAKPHEDLPSYLHHADVNAMCYRTSGVGWWQRLQPLRLYELLAVGRPIVASSLATLAPHANVIALPSSQLEWLSALEQAIEHGGVATLSARRSIAQQNTWERRVSRLEDLLLAVGDNSSGGKCAS